LLKKVRVLDLREAPSGFKVGPRAFAGFHFSEVCVPEEGATPFVSCAAIIEAFDVTEIREFRGAVPLADFDWRHFPQLVDLSGVTWTELPKVPDAVKETLALRSLPAGLRQIPALAFDGCRSLALTALPEGVASIDRFAFRNCSALHLKGLPRGVNSIEEGAFDGCTSLALSTWPEGIENDGRCGVMVVDGVVKLVRRVKL
jgi:hypothetical protein